jgi:hypothetical protein
MAVESCNQVIQTLTVGISKIYFLRRWYMWQQSREDVESKMRELLKEKPKETGIQIESQEIYDWFISNGVTPGDGDMESVFNSFKREGLIKGAGFNINGKERKQHGTFRITWISKWL